MKTGAVCGFAKMKQLDPLVDLDLGKAPDEAFLPGDFPGCLASKPIKRDPEGGRAKDREGQGQGSLTVAGQKNSDPWDDAKAFLTSFEQVAGACRWPKAAWADRLLPALSGQAREAFNSLESREREDYGKVKAAILREAAFNMEARRQHFRRFRYPEVEDPRKVYGRLRELCHRWLKPERRTKEQIVELLILEQFLAIRPAEIQRGDPESWLQTPDLAEDFLRSQLEAKTWKRQVSVSPKDRIGEARNPVREVPFVENEEHILREWRSTYPDDGNSPCCNPVSLPEGQDFVETGPTEESVDFELAVHFTEEESSSLDPAHTEILQDGREKGTSLDHVPATAIKEETLQPGSPELEGAHKIQGSCGEGLSRPLSQKGGADLDNPEERTPPRRWLWEEGQTVNQHLTHISEEKHSCPECGEQFHHQPLTVQHQRIHTDIQPKERQDVHTKEKTSFSCPGVEKSFTPQGINTGQRSATRGARERRFCEWIQPSQHPLMQGGETAYACSLCQKEFRRKRNLIAHQKTHTGERPHSCPQCGKSFGEKAKLIRHGRVHTGEKPYACPACPKSFSQRETLLRHRRIHTGEKSYWGFVAGENFGQRERRCCGTVGRNFSNAQ